MALTYVTLILDMYTGSGTGITDGYASFTPNATLTDPTDAHFIPPAPVQVPLLVPGTSLPQVSLLATDNANVTPTGWAWTVAFPGVDGNPASFSFFLPSTGGLTQHLSAQVPVTPATPVVAYMPVPTGTATAGFAPLATGVGETSAWGAPNIAADFAATGLTGATAASRYAGATTSGAPVSGTFAVGDFIVDQSGREWICITAGTPGTWSLVNRNGNTVNIQPSPGTAAAAGSVFQLADAGHVHGQPSLFAPTGLTGATAVSRYAGATASGFPATGTFAIGDFVVDRSGRIWVCITAGSPGNWISTAGSAQTQIFTISGTWTMPVNATSVMVWGMSAGGGGGSGASLASGTASSGGGAGSSGLVGMGIFPASLLPASVAVSVGSAGGTGGLSVTSGNGNGGSSGGGTGFGAYLRITGGPGGNGGGTTAASGGNGTSGTQCGASGGAGTLGGTGGSGNQTTNSGGWGSGGGGGGGGGISATPAAFNGGLGGNGVAGTHGTGGVVGGALPTADTATTFTGAGGSGGGASSITGTAQDGAAGVAYGAGGGGGGAALSGSASGNGGAGGPGIVIVTTYF